MPMIGICYQSPPTALYERPLSRPLTCDVQCEAGQTLARSSFRLRGIWPMQMPIEGQLAHEMPSPSSLTLVTRSSSVRPDCGCSYRPDRTEE